MSSSATPTKTLAARELLAGPRSILTVPMRMLLINVDGRRNVAELQDIARSLNLKPHALMQLQRDGWIAGLSEPLPSPVEVEQPAAQAEAEAEASPARVSSAEDLRRLMRAKMFAFDLACRMLAGRDAELRVSPAFWTGWPRHRLASKLRPMQSVRSCSAIGWRRRPRSSRHAVPSRP
jgi:hypothetical protein